MEELVVMGSIAGGMGAAVLMARLGLVAVIALMPSRQR